MAVDAILWMGARFYYSTDGTNYTELTDMIEVGPPDDPTVEEIEATPLNPTSNAAEFLYGLINYGSTSFRQYFNKSRFTTLRARLRTSTWWRTVYPDNAAVANSSKIEWIGAPTKVKNNTGVRNTPISIDVEIKISGAVTFTAGA